MTDRAPGAVPSRTRVVLRGDLDPFASLTPDERRRLLVRVLCELVAYEADAAGAARTTDRLAG